MFPVTGATPALASRIPWILVAALVAIVTGCASLPPLDGRSVSSVLADTAQTRLGRAVTPVVAANPGKAGVRALSRPHDAFAARFLLAAAADKSLDVQYYIWHGDQVGYLLFDALWRAAERGVRVRLLLDDLNTGGLDATIAALDAHPNLEVRLYNPFVQRGGRALSFLTDFTRVNRRMHNKSFTVDNQVSIVGGRNIGNEYLGAGMGVMFVDLDVIVVGAAVDDVSKEFDLYWNSQSAFPAAGLALAHGSDGVVALQARFAATRSDPESAAYLEAVRATSFIGDLLNRELTFEWTTARLVYDDPAKTLDTAARTDVLLFPELVRSIGRPERTLDLVSPYFVPGDAGTEALVAAASRGVRVRILTNSLAASDVTAVHAGYAKRRQVLLRAGVQLYELKQAAPKDPRDEKARFGSSSSSTLHAKTFAVDDGRVFVGSFNFDPRSMRLNTEMGFVIDSPILAQQLAVFFDAEVPRIAYEVRAESDGRLLWIERTSSGEMRFDTEPGTSTFQRTRVNLLSILPIEWLL